MNWTIRLPIFDRSARYSIRSISLEFFFNERIHAIRKLQNN